MEIFSTAEIAVIILLFTVTIMFCVLFSHHIDKTRELKAEIVRLKISRNEDYKLSFDDFHSPLKK